MNEEGWALDILNVIDISKPITDQVLEKFSSLLSNYFSDTLEGAH